MSALRAGLDGNRLSVGASGLSLGLPPGTNPFEHFAGLPAGTAGPVPQMQMAATREDGPALPPVEGDASLDLKVALMIQTMAAFTGAHGEGDWRNRDRDPPRFEFFA